jgi:hypothetical protein
MPRTAAPRPSRKSTPARTEPVAAVETAKPVAPLSTGPATLAKPAPSLPALPPDEPFAARALRLRVQGRSPDDIARTLAIAPEEAQRLVVAELDRLEALQGADESRVARRLELERLETLWRALMPATADGDVRVVAAALRVLERRLRCLGVDAPARSAATTASLPADNPLASLSDEELEAALRQLESGE